MKPYYDDGKGIVIYHGDALAVLASLPDASVDMVATDSPYSSGGQMRGDRMQDTSAKYQNSEDRGSLPEFAGDTRDQRAYGYWCALWLVECLRVAKVGAPICLFTDWRQLPVTTDALQAGGWVWRGIVPWNKTEAARPQKGRFRAQCEYVVWGSKGPMPVEGPALPGFFEKYLPARQKTHIAEKPEEIMREIVAICPPGGVVLDPFIGSGPTLAAARATGRRAIGSDLLLVNCDLAARRLSQEVLAL